ncbi:MAG: zinc metallopeptidase [Bacteroidia bacterium]
MGSYYLLLILVMGISFLVQMRFKNRFNKFSKIPTTSGLSGKEVAEKMLNDNGIHDVKVISSEGMLSDHYNPTNKTVNLSPDVYNGRSVAAAAVAAHECGHAVQHATAYAWLQFRSKMVPVVSVTSNVMPFILIGGILTLNIFPQLLLIGIVLFALTTIFSFVTLPVEYDASARALKWMETTNITFGEEHKMAKSALNWAANTYVVAAISSLATLLYYVMIFMGRRD